MKERQQYATVNGLQKSGRKNEIPNNHAQQPQKPASMVRRNTGRDSNYTFICFCLLIMAIPSDFYVKVGQNAIKHLMGKFMKTQEDLYLEYARCITMTREYNEKHGTDVKPWECVRVDGETMIKTPAFNRPHNAYTFALTILEGKPVFVGDSLYHAESGTKYPILGVSENTKNCFIVGTEDGFDYLLSTNILTRTPPTKKCTFMLGDKELPCPVKTGKENFLSRIQILVTDNSSYGCEFYFETPTDANLFYRNINDALTEARDKE